MIWIQIDETTGKVIDRFTDGEPRGKEIGLLCVEGFQTMKVGDQRRFTGQTVLERVL